MDSKRINRVWAVSLFVVGFATMILAGSNLVAVRLPDIVIRALGILDLIALFLLTFSTTKKQVKRDKHTSGSRTIKYE